MTLSNIKLEEAMNTKAINSVTRESRTSVSAYEIRTYTFKKRKPLPGAYPRNFSPYLMKSSTSTSAVTLSRPEIKRDILAIQQAILDEFPSKYFDEAVGNSEQKNDSVAVAEIHVKKPLIARKGNPRARRSTLSVIQAPKTEAEERRQLRAAVEASRLGSVSRAEIRSGSCGLKFCATGMKSEPILPTSICSMERQSLDQILIIHGAQSEQ